VRDVTACISTVWESGAVEMSSGVDVGGTPRVVPREDGGEGCNSKIVRLLDAAEESGVDVIWIAISVSGGYNSSIDSGAITG